MNLVSLDVEADITAILHCIPQKENDIGKEFEEG